MKIMLTAQQTADYLNVSLHTIRHWTSMKTIPHVKLGYAVRFDRDELDGWIEKRSNKGRLQTRVPVGVNRYP